MLDADGTILDFEAAEKQAIQSACKRSGLDISAAQMLLYTQINHEAWRAFERKEITQEELRVLRFARFLDAIKHQADAAQMAEDFADALSQQSQPIEGALSFLEEASKRVPIIVVTNGIASVQHARFAKSPLRQHIAHFVVSGEVGFAKPDPRMLYHAVALSGLQNANALMVGDEPNSDIAAANAAQIDSCWFNPGGRANTTPHAPTLEITSLSEVMQWI